MTTANRTIRYGIIGFGAFAERTIMPAIQASKNSSLVALQKRSIESARQKALQYGIPHAFSTAEELVRHPEVDAVFIVSANCEHARQTAAAADAGKHVLVEKPMAMNTAQAHGMIEICRRNGVKLMVGHMIRFSPLALRMQQLVAGGFIGQPVAVRADFFYDARLSQRTWLFDPRVAGGGPVFDIGVHCLDTLRFVLQDEVVSIRAELRPPPSRDHTESSAQIALKFSDGTVGSVFCSFETPIRRARLEIIGTEAVLGADDFTLGSRTLHLDIHHRAEESSPRSTREEIAVPNLYVEEITHFSDCILENREPAIPGEVGLENQRLLDAVMMSS